MEVPLNKFISFSKIYKRLFNSFIFFLVRNLIFILIFIFSSASSKIEEYLRFKKFTRIYDSQIKMTIIGKGTKNILSNSYLINPSDVLVNEVSKRNSCTKACQLDEDFNNVTLIFNDEIDTWENMFNNLTSIKEIDLSKFDSSKITTMYRMFNGCTNLEKIIFGNINTSSVNNMKELFQNCKKLTSIDVSKFDTSQVTTMYRMFGFCESLESLDVSNFNTSKVEDMFDMFGYCYKLVTINVSNFDTSHTKNMRGMFYHCYKLKYLDLSNFDASQATTFLAFITDCNSLVYVNLKSIKIGSIEISVFPPNLNCCIEDKNAKDLILGKNAISNCSDICFKENIKIDDEQNKCVEKCDEDKFEFNKICYEKCPHHNPIIINSIKKCLDIIPENFYYDSYDEIYKECYKTCQKCNGPGNIENNNCTKCKEGYTFLNDSFANENNCYEICDFYYYFDENKTHFCTLNNSCPEKFNKIIKEKNKCIFKCKYEEVYIYEYNNICYENCPNGTNTNELIYMCYNTSNIEKGKLISNLQEQLINGDIDDILINITESKEDYIQKEEDIIFQITTSENQKNKKSNISTIDLGDCEERLKNIYEINETLPLIIFKIDYYSSDALIPKIAYEIYHPINKSKLDLKYCEDILIKLNIPVSIDEDNIFKYDPNSGYYTDKCFSYTSENGTDIILSDRKKEFINNNLSLCENNCNHTGYSKESKQSSCDCNVNSKNYLISDILDNPINLPNVFSSEESSSSSNIITMKCTKNLFTKNGLLYNIASYVLLFILTFFIIALLIFIKCGYPLLKVEIENILKTKRSIQKQQKNNKRNLITERRNKLKPRKKIKKGKNNNGRIINLKMINNINLNKENIINSNLNPNTGNLLINKKNKKNILTSNNKKKTKNQNKKLLNSKNKISIKYNNYEMNNFPYQKAIICDKRNCGEYYIYLIKSKILILFGFCPEKDNNSRIIKLCIFFLSFSIYYAINFAFFNEKMIHKIFEDGGKYDIIYFLPKISISFAISHAICIIIKLLFLSERNLMNIKTQPSLTASENVANNEKGKLVRKYIIFFIMSFIFLGFFWILLSSFGAVYQNTQIFIFENSLISFAISFIYEIFINIFPCFFRITSLKSKGHNKECFYSFSKFLQLL